jgi:hypothetical protein
MQKECSSFVTLRKKPEFMRPKPTAFFKKPCAFLKTIAATGARELHSNVLLLCYCASGLADPAFP